MPAKTVIALTALVAAALASPTNMTLTKRGTGVVIDGYSYDPIECNFEDHNDGYTGALQDAINILEGRKGETCTMNSLLACANEGADGDGPTGIYFFTNHPDTVGDQPCDVAINGAGQSLQQCPVASSEGVSPIQSSQGINDSSFYVQIYQC